MQKLLFILIIIGALNWGLIGVVRFDLVAYLFGDMTWVTRGVYTLVGIAGVMAFLKHRKCECVDKVE